MPLTSWVLCANTEVSVVENVLSQFLFAFLLFACIHEQFGHRLSVESQTLKWEERQNRIL